jgi:hypothetical protein
MRNKKSRVESHGVRMLHAYGTFNGFAKRQSDLIFAPSPRAQNLLLASQRREKAVIVPRNVLGNDNIER